MPSGLIALLDDVAAIAKLAAASIDDVGAAAGKAGTKAAGVVIDDTAVTPRYFTTISPERELPIIWKITLGSMRNKLLIILPIALLLAAFAPFLIAPLLLLGGSYLAFEASEKIAEALFHDQYDEEALAEVDSPEELEARQVAGAIRTDFILSTEIMVIALASLDGYALPMQAAALVLVALFITAAVYGVVALIVKLDDIGLHLTQRESASAQSLGRGLVNFVPKLMHFLSAAGTAAMLWVGGGIILHSLDEMGSTALPHFVHDLGHRGAEAIGVAIPIVEWILNALMASVAAAIVGAIILAIFHFRPGRHRDSQPEEVV
ncbi:MAG: DUF808 domain-containing protein [Sphingomicrobium sp.]